MATNISPISPNKFVCNFCTVTCHRQTEWNRHIETKKHISNISCENSNILATTVKSFVCDECCKKYTDRTGLWRHKKKCKTKTGFSPDNLVIELIKQNDEFKSLLLEQNNKMLETFQGTIQEVYKKWDL